MNSTSMLLQDFIDAPSKAESILDNLTTEQVQLIEATIKSVKKRKLEKSAAPATSSCDISVNTMAQTDHSTATSDNTTTRTATMINGTGAATSPASSATLSIANALATAMAIAVANSIQQQQQQQDDQDVSKVVSPKQQRSKLPTTAEMKDGVEWVSFVYSHNRVMKTYTVRTDLDTIQLDQIDGKFKAENCVYPRANIPKDQYKGNRWSYETECNVLGWKLAWLNQTDIAGKRGLIQRAVDSYRNRYPSMRSRRMARQAKLQNGTLRKRKQPHDENEQMDEKKAGLMDLVTCLATSSPMIPYVTPTSLETAIIKPANQPKTIAMEDFATGTRCRIKIHVETVSLEYIPFHFRLENCPFPRHLLHPSTGHRPDFIEENICNELAWKLAWLNPKLLAGKKNMLQRAVDLFRAKFMPSMPPRRHSSRHPVFSSSAPPPISTTLVQNMQDQQEGRISSSIPRSPSPSSSSSPLSPLPASSLSPTMSCMSGTTASLDFSDCLSLADETLMMMDFTPTNNTTNNSSNGDIMVSTSPHLLPHPPMLSSFDEASASSSATCSPSPPSSELFSMLTMDEIYDTLMLPPTVSGDVHNTFMFADQAPVSHMSTTAHHPKLFESPSFLSSPSLPSSTLQQDVLVKMENVDDFTCQLLESFF